MFFFALVCHDLNTIDWFRFRMTTITKQVALPTRRDLQAKVERQKVLIQKLLKDKKALYQKVRRLEKKIAKMQDDHKEELAAQNDSFQISRVTTNPRGWLTPSGNVALAIRRNVGNVACALLGHVILDDISASSVARAEIRTGASLMSHAKHFFEMCRQVFKTASRADSSLQPPPVAVHAFRQDATNSGVWKRSKLAAMEVESFFTDWDSPNNHLCRLADVQKVLDGSAKGTVSMTKKQLESLGCPTWTELQSSESHYLRSGWHVYLQTTDRGSNELAARNLNSVLYDNPKTIFMDFDCHEHATHLCVMSGLAEIDMMTGYKYFANCAILANVLRDVSQLIFPMWASLFGDGDALKHARKLFPKCLSGRWGSIHEFEKQCLDCSGDKLLLVLQHILSEKQSKSKHGSTERKEVSIKVFCFFWYFSFIYVIM